MSLLEEFNASLADEQRAAVKKQQEVAKETFISDMLQTKSLGVKSTQSRAVAITLIVGLAAGLFFFFKN